MEVPVPRIFLVADVLTGIAGALDRSSRRGALSSCRPRPTRRCSRSSSWGTSGSTGAARRRRERRRTTLDLEAIDAAFRPEPARLLLCNPHNPTGRVFTTDELAALAAVVDRHGGRVVADEVHAPLTYPHHRHIPYATVSGRPPSTR